MKEKNYSKAMEEYMFKKLKEGNDFEQHIQQISEDKLGE